MLGKLNLVSLILAIGAVGQYWFYGHLFSHIPAWVVWITLLVPWLTVYTITFCNRPPFGPLPFARCLLFAICWYALLTVGAELLHFALHVPPDRHIPFTVARIVMYFGLLIFIPLVRAYLFLRRLEKDRISAHP